MTDVEKVYTVLELIDEKSKQVGPDEPIVVSMLRLSRSGVSRADTLDIMAMLWKIEGKRCIEIIKWPDADKNLFTNTEDDTYHVKLLSTFYDVLMKYEEYATYERDPKRASKLFPRNDLKPNILRVLAEGGDPNMFSAELETKNHLAVLSFENISRPQVTVGNSVYLLSSMRGGRAFDIINYCLNHSPGRDVSSSLLKTKPGMKGLSNIKAAIQHSHFDIKNGALRVFIHATPGSIRVAQTVHLTESEIDTIKVAALN